MTFTPDLTPDQMKRLGVLHGVYTEEDPRKSNFFGVPASMKTWNETWLHESAPQGWYEWYQGYVQGKRTPDDERQMKRWASFRARHVAQLEKADPSLKNLSIQPKRRQALLNWGIAPGIDVDRAVEAGSVNKYLEKVASKKEKDSVGMAHKGGIAYVSGAAASMASYPVLHGLKKSMGKDLPKTKVTEGDVASYRKAKNLRHVKRHGGEGMYYSPHAVHLEAQANKNKFIKPSRNRLGEIHATNPAVAMHEYGHAHSYKSGKKMLRGAKTGGYIASTAAHSPIGRLALAATATSKDDRKSKGAVAASVALSAPQLVEEARASISPYKHLKKTKGAAVAKQFGKTMGKAFGTYGVNAAATVGATVMARSWAKSVRAKKDKEKATLKHL